MFRSGERGRRSVVVGRAILLVALLGLWGMPSEAQDRVARPGAAEAAVLTYPLVIRVQLTERRATPTGYATSTRLYSEALVSAANQAVLNGRYCNAIRISSRGEWPCGATPTDSRLTVSVAVGPVIHGCQIQVPKVVAAPRLVLNVTIRKPPAPGTSGTECEW